MGVLTDICIATEAELAATHFEGSAIPSAFFPTVQGKSLDPVMLAILEAVVTERTPDMDTLVVRMDDEPLRGDASSEE